MDELLDCKLIWEKAQPEIKEGMTEMSYSLWISGLEPVCILSDMLILQSMNEVTLDTLKSLYSDQIADALSHASGVNLRPMFICGDERPKYEKLMAEKKRRRGRCPTAAGHHGADGQGQPACRQAAHQPGV